MSTDIRGRVRRGPLKVALAAIAAFAVLVPLIFEVERRSLATARARVSTVRGQAEPFAEIAAPGLALPPTTRAEGSGMLDEDEVVGVEAGGRARAYRLAALRGRTRHVLNDMVGGVPVSVAYCDMTNCVRAYVAPRGPAPLDVSVGGLYVEDGPQMVVKVDGAYYFHKSGKPIKPGPGSTPLPYEVIEPTRTTWKDWVKRHPDTDVYCGDRSRDLK